jgi:hypothetical protein
MSEFTEAPVIIVCQKVNDRVEMLVNTCKENYTEIEKVYNFFSLFEIWNQSYILLKKKYNLPDIPLLGNGFSEDISEETLESIPISIKGLNWNFAKIYEIKANELLDNVEEKLRQRTERNKLLIEGIISMHQNNNQVNLEEFIFDLFSKNQWTKIVKELYIQSKSELNFLDWIVYNFPDIIQESTNLRTM